MKNSFSSPIDHKVLPDKIVNYIRDKIINGELKPGDKVSEATLSEELKISRTPIREAIRLLECEGFIELIPRKGSVVKSYSKKDIINTFELKGVIEAFGVFKAAQKLSEKEIEKLSNYIENEKKYLEKLDIAKFFKEFDKFNNTLSKNCTNQYLLDINLKMNNHIVRYRYFCFKFPEILNNIIYFQEEIIVLLKKQDFNKLREVYEKYILDIGQKMCEKMTW
jgi:DNA-binding GntR family transcriptional regulator